MAITFYCGRPGSGKSYGVIENVILPALQKQRLIYTNIPLQLDAITQDFPEAETHVNQFTNDMVNGDYLMAIPGGALIVIDECWRYWPSGMKSSDMPLQDKEFFAEHRHKAGADQLTQEIILVTQSPSQIAKCVKDLIDQTVMTVKADKVGMSNKYQVKIFSACIPSIDRPGEPNQTGFGTYKPEIYKYYKSHTKSETGLAGIEIKADKRGTIWSHWYIRYVAPIVFIGGIWGTYYTYRFFTGDAFGTKQPEIVEITPQIPTPSPTKSFEVPQTPNVAREQPKPESKRFRVSGVVYHDGIQVVYLEDIAGETRAVDAKDCSFGLNGAECVVNGEIVSKNTGIRPQRDKDQRHHLTDIVPAI